MKKKLMLILMMSLIGMTSFAQNSTSYVDLGLSVSWATCNLGTTKPEGYGKYYAFGEVSAKETFTDANCKSFNKSMADYSGNSTYDAATYALGNDWRTPTKQEMEELTSLCLWEWIKLNGISGYKVTGPNGNSIFLPAAGCDGTQKRTYAGSNGYYRTSSPVEDGENASSWVFGMDNMATFVHEFGTRSAGYSIRPVYAKSKLIEKTVLDLIYHPFGVLNRHAQGLSQYNTLDAVKSSTSWECDIYDYKRYLITVSDFDGYNVSCNGCAIRVADIYFDQKPKYSGWSYRFYFSKTEGALQRSVMYALGIIEELGRNGFKMESGILDGEDKYPIYKDFTKGSYKVSLNMYAPLDSDSISLSVEVYPNYNSY